MNYIKSMQKALEDFRFEAVKIDNQITEARNTYREDIAQSEIDRLEGILANKKTEALNTVTQALSEATNAAKEWGRLDGSKMTDDAKLLSFTIDPDDFNHLVEKYQDNGTMSKLLYSYAEEHNRMAKEKNPQIPPPYGVSGIATVDKRVEKYGKRASTATDLINRLTGTGHWMEGVKSDMLNSAIDTYLAYKE